MFGCRWPMRGAVLILALATCWGCSPDDQLLAISDVTLIDGSQALPRRGATVLVQGDRIVAVGPADSVRIPRSARRIDGSDKFLIPGLWDMHVHLRDLEGTLPLFVVNGVTSVRDMGSELAATASIRDQVRTGARIGPRIRTSGMMVESASWVTQYVELLRSQGSSEQAIDEFLRTRITVGSVEEAEMVVDSLLAGGADFIKIRHAESPEVFAAISDAAGRAGTHLSGHYVWILGLDESADLGQRSIEHNILPGFDRKSPEQKQAIFDALRRNGAHLVPTLVTNAAETSPMQQVRAMAEDSTGLLDPRNRYVSRSIRASWLEYVAVNEADDERPPPDVILGMIAGSNRFLSGAYLSGVRMMTGTDVPTTGTFLGFSLHDELELLVETFGMTPHEALSAATSVPAEFLGLDAELGTIEAGMLADLVLLDRDPLAEIGNTRCIDTVIADGRVYDRATRQRLLSEIESANASGEADPARQLSASCATISSM